MSQASSVLQENASQTASRLVAIGELDTLYRDLYLQRARELMQSFFSNASYTSIKNGVASLDLVERQLRGAVERGDWKRTTELTEQVRATRRSATAKASALELGDAVYGSLANIPIDPFSKGFYTFYGATAERLKDWQGRAVSTLAALESSDPTKTELYSRRRNDFQSLGLEVQVEKKKEAAASPTDLRQQALTALDSGDLAQLDSLIQQLSIASETKEDEQKEEAVKLGEVANLGADLHFQFSEETLAAAGRLGLAPARTSNRRHYANLLSYEWQPSFLKRESKKWAQEQLLHLMPPSDSGDKVRDAIELYLLNPFMTSGGTRYKVCLVEEDLLIEDFPEPEPKSPLPRTELLSALELDSRWGLSRIDIENALLKHGSHIIEQSLKLDPEAFRLVAVPPDIYTNLGPERGWGQKEMWTHFDGYWIREGGELQALGGGDKRFGGSHDVVSFSPNYTTEKLLTRFSVVQRKRMMTWHKH